MNYWHQYPLLRVFIPFVCGIICASFFSFDSWLLRWAIPLLLIALVPFVYFSKSWLNYQRMYLFGLLVVPLFLILGFEYSRQQQPMARPAHYVHFLGTPSHYLLRMLEPAELKPRSVRLLAAVEAQYRDGKWMESEGKLLVYLRQEPQMKIPEYGQFVLAKMQPKPILPPANPGEFDYRRYLTRKGVVARVFLAGTEVELLKQYKRNWIYQKSFWARQHILTLFRQQGLDGKEFGLVSALLLGDKSFLDEEMVSDFSGAGAMHVLCVSGLHVGIVYMVLAWMLGWLDAKRWGRVIKYLLIFVVLWFYAFLTGLTPSVMRACLMFSFFAIGKLLNRPAAMYNVLLASAFCLLLIDPMLLFQVGFQLSYLAVFGIVWLQPKINQLWLAPNRILQWVWALVAVSIAAQLFTAPLAAFYFHQLPVYFLLTNLLVIPMASLVIYFGLASLLFAAIPLISDWLNQILLLLLKITHTGVHWIEGLPGSTLQPISINEFQTLVLFAVIIFIASAWLYKSYRFGRLGLLMLLVLGLMVSYSNFQSSRQKRLVIYSTPKGLALDFIYGHQYYPVRDSVARQQHEADVFRIAGSQMQYKLRQRVEAGQLPMHHFSVNQLAVYSFQGIRLGILQGDVSPLPFQLDWLIMSASGKVRISELHAQHHFSLLIIPASSAAWKRKRWIAECEELGIPYYDIKASGAFSSSMLEQARFPGDQKV